MLVPIYLTFSLCLIFIVRPDCPTYMLLHLLHALLYISLGYLLVCFSVSWFIVLVTRKALFRVDSLNKLTMRLISVLIYVKIIHFLLHSKYLEINHYNIRWGSSLVLLLHNMAQIHTLTLHKIEMYFTGVLISR